MKYNGNAYEMVDKLIEEMESEVELEELESRFGEENVKIIIAILESYYNGKVVEQKYKDGYYDRYVQFDNPHYIDKELINLAQYLPDEQKFSAGALCQDINDVLSEIASYNDIVEIDDKNIHFPMLLQGEKYIWKIDKRIIKKNPNYLH